MGKEKRQEWNEKMGKEGKSNIYDSTNEPSMLIKDCCRWNDYSSISSSILLNVSLFRRCCSLLKRFHPLILMCTRYSFVIRSSLWIWAHIHIYYIWLHIRVWCQFFTIIFAIDAENNIVQYHQNSMLVSPILPVIESSVSDLVSTLIKYQ